MLAGWRRRAGLGLLVFGLVAVAGPVSAALEGPSSCCPGMQAGGSTGGHAESSESAPGRRCQWLTPLSCCEQASASAGAPLYAPVLPTLRLEPPAPPSPPRARVRAPLEVAPPIRDVIATVVLLL